jgi:hypothetical protein
MHSTIWVATFLHSPLSQAGFFLAQTAKRATRKPRLQGAIASTHTHKGVMWLERIAAFADTT